MMVVIAVSMTHHYTDRNKRPREKAQPDTMDTATARLLANLTSDFYVQTASSFSATRQSPWEGWRRVIGEAAGLRRGLEPLSVLDAGCGNLRFEHFLSDENVAFRAVGVDGCPALVAEGTSAFAAARDTDVPVKFVEANIVEALLRGADPFAALDERSFDLAVAFGVMHHVPTAAARRRLLGALVERTRPGGIVAVSFWRFADDARLLKKARAATAKAQERFGPLDLDAGDHLLQWQRDESVFRYCHHASDDEIADLAASCAASADVVASFSADGASGRLNRYLVLRKR
ncbi:methyltransferase domain-containing protein [Eggerthellaceae bacterium zg-887]|nr:methyltransferase domain-containing protein [Xiamenia xianingshaonis]